VRSTYVFLYILSNTFILYGLLKNYFLILLAFVLFKSYISAKPAGLKSNETKSL